VTYFLQSIFSYHTKASVFLYTTCILLYREDLKGESILITMMRSCLALQQLSHWEKKNGFAMEKAALCKTGLQNKEMPPLKSLEDSSIQIESMQTAFGQPPITETCQKSYIYCPSEVACPAQSGLYYCTMKRDSSSI